MRGLRTLGKDQSPRCLFQCEPPWLIVRCAQPPFSTLPYVLCQCLCLSIIQMPMSRGVRLEGKRETFPVHDECDKRALLPTTRDHPTTRHRGVRAGENCPNAKQIVGIVCDVIVPSLTPRLEVYQTIHGGDKCVKYICPLADYRLPR